MDYSVLFVIPNERMIKTVRRVMAEVGSAHPVCYGSRESALELAERMIAERGAKVVVSTGLTAEFLQARLPVPVLKLGFSNVEFASAINEAKRYSNRILVVGSDSVSHFMKKSFDFLHDPALVIGSVELSGDGSIEEQLEEHLAGDRYDVVVSASPGVRQAQSRGKIGILFDVDEKMVEFALQNAHALRDFVRGREEKELIVTTVLNYSLEGMMIVDAAGAIMQLNSTAEKLIGITDAQARGRQADEVLRSHKVVDVLHHAGEIEDDATHVFLSRIDMDLAGDRKGMLISLRGARELRRLGETAQKALRLKGHVAKKTFADIVGQSPAVAQAKGMARRFAWHNSTVLILGETGTGKELFAQSIHNESRRRGNAFVAVNCAALPESLLESELFGYVKGAFTGARSEGKDGLFAAADHGTVFLDEIGEIPPQMQARLLRVLQEREIMRVGDDRVVPVDVRIIAASNQDLLQMVREGRFREDLYYRLSVLELFVPPLRERREDIEALVASLIAQKNAELGKHIGGPHPQVLKTLSEMDWPGNIRQLGNCVEKLMILTDGPQIGMRELRLVVDQRRGPGERRELPVDRLDNVERRVIQAALRQTNGNKTAAAHLLGINSSTLWRKLKHLESTESGQ